MIARRLRGCLRPVTGRRAAALDVLRVALPPSMQRASMILGACVLVRRAASLRFFWRANCRVSAIFAQSQLARIATDCRKLCLSA
jgi:hypothetical protein